MPVPLTSHGVGLCSEQAAKDAILYSYRHGFSGFAAVLTDNQAARLAGELTLLFCSVLSLPCVMCDVDKTPAALLCVLAQFELWYQRFAWGCASGAESYS
jgi:hypothetical protein